MKKSAHERAFNPFIIKGYRDPEHFCDREKETETILQAVQNGRDLVLLLPRRIGKTGLMQHAFHRIRQELPPIKTFYLDVFSTQDLSDFVRLLGETVLGSMDPLTGMPSVSLDFVERNETTTLQEIFDYLKASETPCVIAIDEFQQINEYPEKGIEALLRSLIQFAPHVHWIFAGSKQHLMEGMLLSPKRPFYQSAQLLPLQVLERETYYDFCSRMCKERYLYLDRDLFYKLYDRYDGYTWYIQRLMNRLFEFGVSPVEELLDAATREIVEENDDAYARLLNTQSASCRRLLKAVAKENCVKEILSGAFIQRHGLKAASSVQSATKKLLDEELLYKTDKGYIVYDRFMAEWLKGL